MISGLEIYHILKDMEKACPVKCKVFISLEGDKKDIVDSIRFTWHFKIKREPYAYIYETTIADYYEIDMNAIKKSIKSVILNGA